MTNGPKLIVARSAGGFDGRLANVWRRMGREASQGDSSGLDSEKVKSRGQLIYLKLMDQPDGSKTEFLDLACQYPAALN